MYCEHCLNIIELDRENIYGYICPFCHNRINPKKDPNFVSENKEQLNIMRQKVRGILRKKVQQSMNVEINDGNFL